MKVTLLKIDTKDKIREWTIEVKKDSYRTIHGEQDGALVTTEWTVCKGKNIGKKNETSPEKQAVLEAEAIIKKQREKGYGDTAVKKTGDVMLAKNYDDYKEKIKFPVYCQPKLDGIRCYITKDGMFTRNHKPIVACPHIFNTIKTLKLFENFPNLKLDGELYNPVLKEDFNKICSLVKRTKPTKEDLEESKKIVQFWLYDIADTNKKFSDRTNWISTYLKDKDNSCIKILTTDIAFNQKELDIFYEAYMKDGNEGQMIRLDESYEEKRSKSLLKRKEFQDDEFVIQDILEGVGNRAGMAGAIVTKTKEGVEFNSNIKLNWEELEGLLKNRKNYIGTICTIKYFNLTPDKLVPRFPYVIKLHGKEKV